MKNKRCKKMGSWIEPYFDGELPSSKSLLVESHLKECPSCGAALERLDRTRSWLREGLSASATEVELEALSRRVRAGIRQPERPGKGFLFGDLLPRWSWGTRLLAPSAAVMVLLAVFIFTIYKPHPPVIKTEGKNACIIDSIEGDYSTMMFFKTHGSKITVIWVSGKNDLVGEAAGRWIKTSV